MTGTTSVPPIVLGPTGFVAPDTPAILAGVQADINAALGGNANPGLSTPQGQLATSDAAIISDTDDQFVYICNQTDPAFAEGRFQDALGRYYFLERFPAEPTVVNGVQCIGVFGTVIPAGSLAQAQDGNLYSALAGGTIPVGGTLLLAFQCVTPGPIACPATSLDEIYGSISGWDRVTNPQDGIIGRNAESRTQFEARREQSVALNSRQVLDAVLANVLALPGVLDAYATENDTGGNVTVGGVVLQKNCLYVCVSGGVPAAVANAIWVKKGPGCAYAGVSTINGSSISGTTLTVGSVGVGAVAAGQAVFDRTGNVTPGTTIISGSGTTWTISPSQTVASESMFLVDPAYTGVVVQDTNAGYVPPLPSYVVSYRQATATPILFAITLQNSTAVPANAAALISTAIEGAFAGTDNGAVPRIGSLILSSRFIAPIAAIAPWAANIISIQIGSANTPVAVGTGSITTTVLTISAVTTTGFAVGQSITGPNIVDGTIILSLGSGTGGTGTYNLNQSQTAASGAVFGAIANQNSVQMGIAQEPSYNPVNLSLTLV